MDIFVIVLYIVLYAVVKVIAPQTENVLDKQSICEFYNGVILQEGEESNQGLSWFACNSQTPGGYCPKGFRVCLLDHSSNSRPVALNLGKILTAVPEELLLHTTRRLHSNSSFEKCKDDLNRNYTIYVTLDESLAKSSLRRLGDDRCAIELRIPDPRSDQHSCMKRLDGGRFVLDFRKLSDDFVVEESDGTTWVFNLCRSATRCDDPKVSSCSYASVAGNPTKIVWGEVKTRQIAYEDGAVKFTFQRGSKRSGGLITEVDIRCNWSADLKTPADQANHLPRPIYLSRVSSQRKSKFVIESSLGCVKLPMNCKFVGDDYNDEYDLSDLYRPNGDVWNVENDRNTSIRMNICGPMKNYTVEECKKTHSQICGEILFGEQRPRREQQQLSYGSILVDKRTDGGDILTARLVHGSICPKYSNTTLTTNLKWKCSQKEKGPKLLNIYDCSIDILWETPKACPIPRVITAESSLNIYDHLGNRNLTGLCVGDRTNSITSSSSSPSSYLTYNFCTPLTTTKCNGLMNGANDVSMCLHTKRGNKKILGYFKNTKLTSRNGILSMEVIGDNCLKANVSFHCDYSAPAGGIVRIFPNDDNGCSYDISVKLPSVCVTKLNGDGDRSKVCSIKSGTSTTYDLTALTKYDENYRILNNNSGSTVEFQLNICNPLITGDATSLCKPQTAICLHNTSEPNFKKRIEPVVVETTPQTSYRNSSCVIPYDSGKVINLTSIERKQFQIYHEKERANLTFNVCTMNYTKTYTNGRKEILYFNRTITYKNMEYYLGHQINCETTTSDDSNWNSLNMKLDCRYDDDVVFKLLYINNCTAYIQCNSALFCENNTRNSANPFAIEADQLQNVIEVLLQKWPNLTLNVRDVDIKRRRSDAQNAASKNENRKIKKNEENSVERGQQQQAPSTIYRNVTVCIITIGTKEIYLNKLAPVTLKSRSGNRYTIGMGGVEGGGGRQRERANMCNDYICKDGKTVATLNTCPNVSVVVNNSNGGGGDVSRSSPEVRLTFNYTMLHQKQEQPFVTTMFLKCNLNSNNNEKSIANFEVNDENDTSLTLSYPMEEVCLAPPVSSSSNVVLLAVGCIILTVLLVVIVMYFLYKRRTYLRLRKADKSSLYLYARDAQV